MELKFRFRWVRLQSPFSVCFSMVEGDGGAQGSRRGFGGSIPHLISLLELQNSFHYSTS